VPAGRRNSLRRIHAGCGFPCDVPFATKFALIDHHDRHGLTSAERARSQAGKAEIAKIEKTVRSTRQTRWLMLCGSLRPACREFLRRPHHEAHKRNVKRCSIRWRRAARSIEARPTVATPNNRKRKLLNTALLTRRIILPRPNASVRWVRGSAPVARFRGAIGALPMASSRSCHRVEAVSPLVPAMPAAAFLWRWRKSITPTRCAGAWPRYGVGQLPHEVRLAEESARSITTSRCAA